MGQRLSPKRRKGRRTPLLARLEQTRRVLEEAYDRLTAAADSGTGVGPAGEWLSRTSPMCSWITW